MYAKIAAEYLHAWCRAEFPDRGTEMASHVANGSMIDVFDHIGHGTHKYIPADKLTQDLGEPVGAGVYSYWKMKDGSYLLLTCKGTLAYWSGQENEAAKWGK